jgi:hypothetical protein
MATATGREQQLVQSGTGPDGTGPQLLFCENETAKASPDDLLMAIQVTNAGPAAETRTCCPPPDCEGLAAQQEQHDRASQPGSRQADVPRTHITQI